MSRDATLSTYFLTGCGLTAFLMPLISDAAAAAAAIAGGTDAGTALGCGTALPL